MEVLQLRFVLNGCSRSDRHYLYYYLGARVRYHLLASSHVTARLG
ncbi:unnamed protein product [Amoebophrya sp. A120]|nr:unnamed protein product [Amoebophrya sp. A120]|eukprot:GSA120T00015331001.1